MSSLSSIRPSHHINNSNDKESDSNINQNPPHMSPPSPLSSPSTTSTSTSTSTSTALAFPTRAVTSSTFLSNLLPPSYQHRHAPTAEETISLLLHAYFYLLIILVVYLNHTFDTLSPSIGWISILAPEVVYGSLLARGWEVAFSKGGMRGGMTPRRCDNNHNDGDATRDSGGEYWWGNTAWLWWNIVVTFICLDMLARMDGVTSGTQGYKGTGQMREVMTSAKTAVRVLLLMVWVGVLWYGEWKLREGGEEKDGEKEEREELISEKGSDPKKAKAKDNVMAARKVYGVAANKKA